LYNMYISQVDIPTPVILLFWAQALSPAWKFLPAVTTNQLEPTDPTPTPIMSKDFASLSLLRSVASRTKCTEVRCDVIDQMVTVFDRVCQIDSVNPACTMISLNSFLHCIDLQIPCLTACDKNDDGSSDLIRNLQSGLMIQLVLIRVAGALQSLQSRMNTSEKSIKCRAQVRLARSLRFALRVPVTSLMLRTRQALFSLSSSRVGSHFPPPVYRSTLPIFSLQHLLLLRRLCRFFFCLVRSVHPSTVSPSLEAAECGLSLSAEESQIRLAQSVLTPLIRYLTTHRSPDPTIIILLLPCAAALASSLPKAAIFIREQLLLLPSTTIQTSPSLAAAREALKGENCWPNSLDKDHWNVSVLLANYFPA
jgi:hypothetical protein